MLVTHCCPHHMHDEIVLVTNFNVALNNITKIAIKGWFVEDVRPIYKFLLLHKDGSDHQVKAVSVKPQQSDCEGCPSSLPSPAFSGSGLCWHVRFDQPGCLMMSCQTNGLLCFFLIALICFLACAAILVVQRRV